ncbi:unnamed protein product [Schistocephalus solidus]|uniref:Uncharacterized protein n=1 Tax=Schistocephalus solidus TaxID=70667 RepID=A0A183TSI3_SCHSO|nr:unnamed protein product [Schistocephalus solidus]
MSKPCQRAHAANITDTFLPPPPREPIRATNTTCTTPTTSDYLHHHHRPQYQRWELGTKLSSLRSHIHLTHRPARLIANPSHSDWHTSAWSINTQQRPPPPMPPLPTRIHSSFTCTSTSARITSMHPSHPTELSTLPTHIQAPRGPIRLRASP